MTAVRGASAGVAEPAGTLTLDTELVLSGMTCASCAARIERTLNRLDGVDATVNFATEKAAVRHTRVVSEDALVAAVRAAGYDATVVDRAGSPGDQPLEQHDDDATADALRARLVVSAALTVPIVGLAMVPAWQFTGWQWVSLVLATPVVLWGGGPFHLAALRNLRHGTTTMDSLVSMGTLAAYLWSVYALVLGTAGALGMRHGFELSVARGEAAGQVYFEAAAGITTFLLAGRYAEARAKRASGAAMRALLSLGAKDVSVLRDGVEHRLPMAELAVGDRFLVRPGEKVATDGVVVQGESALDASLLTGESVPIAVSAGDSVTGATVNGPGRLVVRATRVGADTQLAQIARLVDQAQNGKARVQRLADRVSAVFVPVVVVLALATAAGWLLAGQGWAAALSAAIAVLIIACPCALGLATPTALMVGTGRGAQLGILIRGPEVLESTRRVDTIVLDKTGTLTAGRMSLVDVVLHGTSRHEAVELAGAVAAASEHPVSVAVAHWAYGEGVVLPQVTSFASRSGHGVRGVVDDRLVLLGRLEWVRDELAVAPPAELTTAAARAEASGGTAVAAGWDGAVRAVFVGSDQVKPNSAAAVAQLTALGLDAVLLTGDNERAALAVAAQVGLDQVLAGVLPEGKAEAVRRLQANGRTVAMVGDGVNDAPALAQADLGLALGTGADAAIHASDLTLVRGDLGAVPDAIRLSRRTLRTIKQNLFWAFGYNVAAIPLAAAGLLNPMIAGAAMALSSLAVVTNSLRLRSFR